VTQRGNLPGTRPGWPDGATRGGKGRVATHDIGRNTELALISGSSVIFRTERRFRESWEDWTAKDRLNQLFGWTTVFASPPCSRRPSACLSSQTSQRYRK